MHKSLQKKKKGRPSINWDQLYIDWINSGLSKNVFLNSKGIKYKGGSVSRNTRHWLKNLCDLSLRLHGQYMLSLEERMNQKGLNPFDF